jgi:hypothetical protein
VKPEAATTLRSTSNLYKFLRADGLVRLLSTRAIRFTQPAHLNDPYECHLMLDRAARNQLIDEFYARLKENQPNGSDGYLRERALANEQSIVETALEHYRDARKELGVLSLSETASDLLMWAHYGDEHKGAVVELEYTHPSILLRSKGGDEFSGLFAVDYSDTKIAEVPSRDSIVEALLTKSKAWEYEKEWRVIRTLNRLRNVGGDVFVADVAPAAIKQIVLGARFPADQLEDVMNQVDCAEMKHIAVNRSVLKPHRFGVRFVTVQEYALMRLHRSHHYGGVAEEAMLSIPMVDDDEPEPDE